MHFLGSRNELGKDSFNRVSGSGYRSVEEIKAEVERCNKYYLNQLNLLSEQLSSVIRNSESALALLEQKNNL